ncbi:MAG: methyltransferase domain-containing protein [Victivallales bacterium]|nr:methyltransferase domain-containing protein [Victivallales bacterium]
MRNKIEDKYINILSGEYCRLDRIITLPPDRLIEVDMGCGKGSFATQLAARYPDRLVIAADVMIGRLRKLVKRNEREGIVNMRALRVEARSLLVLMMPDRTVHRLHILCPDPWPKDRHRANRLLCADFMGQIHRILQPGGMFHFSTDDVNYLTAVEQVVTASGLFDPYPEGWTDIADLKTDFERLWNAEGKAVQHHVWRRREPVDDPNYRGH